MWATLECRRLSGFDGWRSGEKSTDGCEDVVKNRKSFLSIEPDVGRVAHGIPKRVDRIKGLGNAIVPQIAEQIGRVIMRLTMRLVFDLETDGLLPDLTKIHCLAIKDVDTQKVYSFEPIDVYYGIRMLSEADEHDIIQHSLF